MISALVLRGPLTADLIRTLSKQHQNQADQGKHEEPLGKHRSQRPVPHGQCTYASHVS
jgi:hypothetical protein